jgi:alanine racemase
LATSRLEIDLSAVERNLTIIRSVLGDGANTPREKGGVNPVQPAARPRPAVCAVVKQDGYGLGAVRLAKKLVGSGVEMLAVYTLDEARALTEAIAGIPVLVLMPVTGIDRMDPLYRHLSNGRVHLTLHSDDQLRQLTEMSVRIGATMPVHVQVDTGLSRGGAMPDLAHRLVQRVVTTPRIKLAGLMTHFASPCCDAEFTREQARLFRDFVEGIKPVLKAAVAGKGGTGALATTGGIVPPQELMLHAANSCAAFRARSYHGTMARIGQALLGFALEDVRTDERSGFEFSAEAARLEPAMRWTTTVAHISDIPAGWPVGYGSAWRAPWRPDGKPTRIALLPVGYADGYARALGGKGTGGPGWVGLTGRAWEKKSGGENDEGGPVSRAAGSSAADSSSTLPVVYAPVVGRVSMDQITVDITDVPERYLTGAGPIGSMEGGPEVELMGRTRTAPNFITTMAAASGSITHEQLCRIGPRVERVYRYPAASATGHTTQSSSSPPAPIRLETAAVTRPVVAPSRNDETLGSMAAYAR